MVRENLRKLNKQNKYDETWAHLANQNIDIWDSDMVGLSPLLCIDHLVVDRGGVTGDLREPERVPISIGRSRRYEYKLTSLH